MLVKKADQEEEKVEEGSLDQTSKNSSKRKDLANDGDSDNDDNNDDDDDDAVTTRSSPSRMAKVLATIADGEIDESNPVNNTNSQEGDAEGKENNNNNNGENATPEPPKPIKLYKSSRLKGYITLTLASFINYDAAQDSGNVSSSNLTIVSSTGDQRRYAVAVAVVSLVIAAFCLVTHLDRITPLEKIWITIFKAGSKFEGVLVTFLTIWWSVGVGVATSVTGIAGDGKGQYSLYYSSWVCTITSYWVLERWCVAAGWSSLKEFIASWPNRSPAWICIMFLSLVTLIWYLDLWQNHRKTDRTEERYINRHFASVGRGQWQWLIIVAVFTFCPSVVFVLIELFRETKADGTITPKSSSEIVVEGICFLCLVLAWIPTVMIATTPRGAASLIGNAYFFTWLLTIFVFEGFIWYMHDKRKETHYALKEKEAEYRRKQRAILKQTKERLQKEEKIDDLSEYSSSQRRIRSQSNASEIIEPDTSSTR